MVRWLVKQSDTISERHRHLRLLFHIVPRGDNTVFNPDRLAAMASDFLCSLDINKLFDPDLLEGVFGEPRATEALDRHHANLQCADSSAFNV